jgi:hypothetical protein
MVNGDATPIDPTVVYAGTAQNAVDVGDYQITATGKTELGYVVQYRNAEYKITATVEPVTPPTPIVPVVPPTPSRNAVVVAGGGNSFQLAGAEGTCSADTLEQCECESATSSAGISVQICYESQKSPSSAL